jgi:hypothetical protein
MGPPPFWYYPAGTQNAPRDRLTFGVEFEFGLATILEDDGDPDDGDPRAGRGIDVDNKPDELWSRSRNHIVNTLRQAGIPAEASLHNYTSKAWKPDNIKAWGVKEDDTIRCTGTGYRYLATEVVSPPFYFSIEAIQEVKYVCTLLSNNYRLVCNNTCALHVHVGNGRKGFNYETAQKLMATYFTFEPQIEQIHPPHRVDNYHCPKLRKSTLMTTKVINKLRTVRQGLARIFKGQEATIEELHKDTTPEVKGSYGETRRSAVTIGELLSLDEKKTVEFRQHEMTLDPMRVDHWIRLCVGIIEFSDTIEKDLLEQFLDTLIDQPVEDLSLREVLESIGLPREADFYARRLAQGMDV